MLVNAHGQLDLKEKMVMKGNELVKELEAPPGFENVKESHISPRIFEGGNASVSRIDDNGLIKEKVQTNYIFPSPQTQTSPMNLSFNVGQFGNVAQAMEEQRNVNGQNITYISVKPKKRIQRPKSMNGSNEYAEESLTGKRKEYDEEDEHLETDGGDGKRNKNTIETGDVFAQARSGLQTRC